jgi:hypothetical protein
MRMGVWLLAASCAGCAQSTKPFTDNPGHYGLFVASTWLYADNPVTVQDADSGKTYAIQIKRIGTERTTYLVQSLPPGHYYVYSLASYSGGSAPLKTGNSYFEVQADCFNYAGHVDLQSLDQEQPDLYSDGVTAGLKQLPPDIKALVEGRDICISALGHASQRIPAAQARELFDTGT